MPAILQTAWWWKPARNFSRGGVATHVSDPKKVPIAPLTYRIYPLSSYLPLLSPISSPFSPTFPDPIAYSAPPLASHSWRMTECVPITSMKAPPSAAYHTPRRLPPIRSSVSATTNPCCFLSYPCKHISEVGCARLSASCGTNM